MASVILNPIFQVHNAGVPVSGGKVYTYECGTQTDKTTYTDYAQGTANANPVILDSNGQADIYCSGCLKVLIKDSADVTLDTIDNIQGFDSTVIQDADRDTKIQVEESDDEDIIRFDVAGTQKAYIDSTGWHGTVSFDQGKGDKRRPVFSWTDDDTLSIGAGGAYHHAGTSDQFVYWTSAITYEVGSGGSNADSDDLGNSTWYYLYIDDSAVVTQASPLLDADCFLLVDDAPTWSGSKYGWYGDDSGTATTTDRCIFAVLTDGTADLVEWHHAGDYVAYITYQQVLSASAALTDAYADIAALTMPAFATMAECTFEWKYVDAYNTAVWRTNTASGDVQGHLIGDIAAGATQQISSQTVITDSSQIIEMKEASNSTNTVNLLVDGWYFPNGM